MKNQYDNRSIEISKQSIADITETCKNPIRLMEICGTHTVSIFKHGIRSVLPSHLTLISGPGCPICVTDQTELDLFVLASRIPNVILTIFGDLLKLPSSDSSLRNERANGKDIRIVYSATDALKLAQKNPDKEIVFPGIGFETTAPTIAAVIKQANEFKIKNFSVVSTHKLIMPVLYHLLNDPEIRVDGLLLPGHVSSIIGVKTYEPLVEIYKIPCVISGFEAHDILLSIKKLLNQYNAKIAKVENGYQRAVSEDGNPKALRIMNEVFYPVDSIWRGIGTIPESGLSIKPSFRMFDAIDKFGLKINPTVTNKNLKPCRCGDVVTGKINPTDCPLFRSTCTPENPIGPCMVSSEGTCAAFYNYL